MGDGWMRSVTMRWVYTLTTAGAARLTAIANDCASAASASGAARGVDAGGDAAGSGADAADTPPGAVAAPSRGAARDRMLGSSSGRRYTITNASASPPTSAPSRKISPRPSCCIAKSQEVVVYNAILPERIRSLGGPATWPGGAAEC